MCIYKNEYYIEDLNRIVNYISCCRENSSVLITGASGLIGSLVVDSLLFYNKLNPLKSIKIYAMGRSLNRLKERFLYWGNDDLLEFIAQDVCVPLDDSMHFDYIIHAASNADPKTYSLYPVQTIQTNVIGITNILEYARKHISTKVLFTSSMEVYGKVFEKVISEDMYGLIDINTIRSGYPESKRVSELLCKSYVKQYDVNATIARLGYIYGPSMTKDDSKVVAQFIRKAIDKKDIILKSKGEQRRSYCYVSDAVAGIFCILFNGKKGEAYNVSNSNSNITIADMAHMIADIVKTKVCFEMPDDIELQGFSRVQDAILDESKLKRLGWNPEYSFEMGIKRTLKILDN